MEFDYSDSEFLSRKKQVESLLNNKYHCSLKDLHVFNNDLQDKRDSTQLFFDIGKNTDIFIDVRRGENLEVGEFRIVNHIYENLILKS